MDTQATGAKTVSWDSLRAGVKNTNSPFCCSRSPGAQRGMVPVGLIVYAVLALGALAVIGAAAYRVNHWCNAACAAAKAETVKETARADAAEQAIAAAKAEAERMRSRWAAETVALQVAAVQLEGERNARFAAVASAARGLPAVDARLRFPTSAAGVLELAISAGNATIARPPGEPAKETVAAPAAAEGAGFDVAGVTAWGVACAKLYAEVADQVTGWQAFYARLQAAQLAEAIH
jgi:hypothetical protein